MAHSWAKLLTRSKISQKAVLFKNELLSCDDSASWLLFYYDVNIINPLTNKLHKLSFFYYNLANIKIVLGRKRRNKKVGNKKRIVLTEEEFYYILLIKTW